MKNVVVLGCTGSVGRQTLEVIDGLSDYRIVGLGCYSDTIRLSYLVSRYHPLQAACITAKTTDFLCGENAYSVLAEALDYDILVAAASSVSSLEAVVIALKRGKRVALANKELLILAGDILTSVSRKYHSQLIPVDSEHSAVFQCISADAKALSGITITCSGGAFRDFSLEQLSKVKASDALFHPNWKMGRKITVDCATLVNKAFEVIEATKLFGLPYSAVEVLVHRQSIVHGFVTLCDGSVIAQMAYPDMHLPIQYALTYPERVHFSGTPLNLLGQSLTFEKIDSKRFPLFDAVVEAGKTGNSAAAFVAGADEAAVNMFLGGAIDYPLLHKIIMESAAKAPICEIDLQNAVEIFREGEVFARNMKGKK